MSSKLTIHHVADYICYSFLKKKEQVSVSKLQKLLYYCQAWNLGLKGKALFDEDFEAWTMGPVSKEIHDRFKGHVMTMPITKEQINLEALESIPDRIFKHIDVVLKNYGDMSMVQLEEFFNENEKPWHEAREGQRSSERTSNMISKKSMRDFYQDVLSDQKRAA